MPTPPSLPPGIELWPGSTADAAWHGFLDATAAGDRGICVSREFPDRLRSYLGARDVAVVWLSNVGREGSIRPGDLEAIAELFRRSLDERAVRAIYLDGVEYLVRLHTLERTLQFLSELDRQAEAKAARVWIPLNPALVDPAATDRMRQQFRQHALE